MTDETENPGEPDPAYEPLPPEEPVEPEFPTDTDDLFDKPPKGDRYRKGVPPAFKESQEKYYQDELTKLERVLDLNYDDQQKVAKDGAKLRAAFNEEVTIRVTEDEALAQRITRLRASVLSDQVTTSALLKIEQTARATRDEALAQQITTVAASLVTEAGKLQASIIAEQTARVTKDEAIAKDVTTLAATVTTETGKLASSIQSETTARVNADGALSSRIDTLNTSVGQNAAAISNEVSARTTAVGAVATSVSNLSTTVGGHTSSISTMSSSINGLNAKWGVKINNNNRVAGVSLNSDANGYSSFDIEANALNVYAPGTNTKMIYWDGSTLVVKGDITANRITASAFISGANAAPDGSLPRPVVGTPTLVGQGTFYTSQQAGYFTRTDSEGITQIELKGFTVYIPTGLYASGGWSTSATSMYLGAAKITGASPRDGGSYGYSVVDVIIGDGSGNYDPSAVSNQIYLRYQFDPSPQAYGTISVSGISWKIVQI